MRRTLTKTSHPRIRAWHRSTRSSSVPSTKTNSKASLLSTKTLESWFQPFRRRQSTVRPTHRNFPLGKLPSAVLAAISSCSLQQLLPANRAHSPHPASCLRLPPPSSCSRPQRASRPDYVIRGSFEQLCLYCPPTIWPPLPPLCLPAWIPFCGRILLSWFKTLGLTFKDQQAGGWLFMRLRLLTLVIGCRMKRRSCTVFDAICSSSVVWEFQLTFFNLRSSQYPMLSWSTYWLELLKWFKLTFVR